MSIDSNQIKDLDLLDKISTFRKEFYFHDSDDNSYPKNL